VTETDPWLEGPENQIAALLVLLDEAATMMSDATGSYGCKHIDNLEDWFVRARPHLPQGKIPDAITAILDGRSFHPSCEPEAVKAWRKFYKQQEKNGGQSQR